ncbi:hypothetical protein QCN29_33755 [Streptomyces sp. HNM0663]|uniref:Uncharacterized protein n=1 Tax=Streptomyces chengmaiensis TaxID=3040919 RepID=A0ABT6HY71_9ACTN|nr:hypothetical protein [Streptomyces chengmaiensis]MDH2393642.1 hypothetical protein [Streptomyces chengmaiensis]
MTHRCHDCIDLDRLLRLIGILGSPTERDFWASWRTDVDGYGYKKIKSGIEGIARSAEMSDMHDHDYRAHDFADYVLLLFATDSPEKEAELVDEIGRSITSGDSQAVGTQFLADLRSTAWRVWRDHHSADAATTIQQWTDAPYAHETEKWRKLRGD